MSLADEYVQLCEYIAAKTALPAVRELHVAGASGELDKSSKFGALVLVDGTVGLTYTGLGSVASSLHRDNLVATLATWPVIELARLYGHEQPWQRVVGMAAVNAISQHAMRVFGLSPHAAGATLDLIPPSASDHIGMVGFFPPLVAQIRARGTALTVVELDTRWMEQADGFEVTLDPTRLRACNKVLCTGTTLINHSLQSILAQCTNATDIIVVGPTAGCLPDPMFARGVTVVAGARVADTAEFIRRWTLNEKWREAAARYALRADDYPGITDQLGQN